MYHRVSSVERGVYEVTVCSHCPYLVFFCLRCQGDNVICVTRHTCWPFYVPVQAIVLSSLLRVLVLVLRVSHTFVILSPRSEDEAIVRQRIFPRECPLPQCGLTFPPFLGYMSWLFEPLIVQLAHVSSCTFPSREACVTTVDHLKRLWYNLLVLLDVFVICICSSVIDLVYYVYSNLTEVLALGRVNS